MICPQTKEDCQFKACAIGRWCAKAHSNTIASRADALSRITTAEPFALPITADEFAAMARDAERYRWFRNKLRDYDGDVALWEHCKGCDYEIKQGANLDTAIDAAMAERNK